MDGHPSFINNNIFISDTYPRGLNNYQSLFQYSKNGDFRELAKLHSHNLNIGEYKCDLHPRYDMEHKKIAVDCSLRGERGLYIFDYLAIDNIKLLKPSERGEYEITDLINIYINQEEYF